MTSTGRALSPEQVFRTEIAAINRRDYETAFALFVSDVSLVDAAGVHDGLERIGSYSTEYFDLFDDLDMQIVRLVADSSQVAAELKLKGIVGGREVEIDYCVFQVIEGGLIRSAELYADSATFPPELLALQAEADATA